MIIHGVVLLPLVELLFCFYNNVFCKLTTATEKIIYIEGWKTFANANEIFGFNGWSSEVKSYKEDFVCKQQIYTLARFIYVI